MSREKYNVLFGNTTEYSEWYIYTSARKPLTTAWGVGRFGDWVLVIGLSDWWSNGGLIWSGLAQMVIDMVQLPVSGSHILQVVYEFGS